jgi:predicted metal-dependent phosphotriesterase family hydrolase
MLGMDMGRRRYWRHYGGEPGLDHLLTTFQDLLERAGISAPSLTRMFVAHPARAFSLRGVA